MSMRPEATGKKAAEVPSYGEASLCYSVPEAGRLLGLTKTAAYEVAAAGGMPTLRLGGRIRVPKIAFHRMLDIEAGSIPDHRRR
jgi:excisionase family DNA binding protein